MATELVLPSGGLTVTSRGIDPVVEKSLQLLYLYFPEEHIIDHSISKQRQTSPERPYDVVFINCDVDIERKWVERVVEMLEDTYDLVCGFKGRDFLEMDYSFQFIQKHTPVVVTFSEMSCRMQPEIRRMENIDRLVAVMVEECSPPIFSFNMKCVDATLEEEQWVKQLLTALHYQKYVETYVSIFSH